MDGDVRVEQRRVGNLGGLVRGHTGETTASRLTKTVIVGS
jgi:hypothetical protein